ncbi:MAG: FAD:protein FMN transferase [Bacteroidales bacterium]|nr:FAD:protein FMN transferase [Bacteroidales bacterium]
MNYIRNFKGWVASIVVLVVFILIKLFSSNDKEIVYQQSSGEKYTTFYNVQYKYADNLSDSIALLLDKFDYSLSPFNSESLLTAINNNDTTVKADNLLIDVLTISGQVYKATSGAFDPTISPLINAWGFGFKTGTLPTDTEIEKLRKLVGMDKITLTSDGKVLKTDNNITLNFSAIAKGYIVDLIAGYLESKGITDYLVNIGGEISCRGVNERGEEWRIGVDKPEESNIIGGDIETILKISDKSLATSGNYRKFKVEDNKKVWHIIDPRTGYPTQARVLSATVIANDCAIADAYATALMVLGVEKGMPLIEADSTLEALLICPGDTSQYKLHYSKGFEKYLK